jgi:sterol 3beta-glucosyltransferase
MQVLLLAPGSRGDVAPAARIGADLSAEGHSVTIVAHADFADAVSDAGCRHAAFQEPMEPAVLPTNAAAGVRAHLAQLRRYMQAGAEAALGASAGAEVVLTNPIAPYGHDIAEALGAPSAETHLQPAPPSREYPPMTASALRLGGLGNLLAGRLAGRMPAPYDPAVDWVRSELGLPREPRRTAQRRRLRAGMPLHHGISEVLLPRPRDWPAQATMDGCWWPLVPRDWAPPQELSRFLEAGPAPVLVTLGSVAVGAQAAEAIAAAVSREPQRFVLQGSGWDRLLGSDLLRTEEDRVCVAGDVPHEWLLPRVSAVVHQAGAGVTAATLRSGVPSVPVPLHTDQHFWARRLITLGAAGGTLRARSMSPDDVVRALGHLRSDSSFRLRAEAGARLLENAEQAAAAQTTSGQVPGTARIREWVHGLDG